MDYSDEVFLHHEINRVCWMISLETTGKTDITAI